MSVMIEEPMACPKVVHKIRPESPPIAGPSKPKARKRCGSPPIALSTRSKCPRLVSNLGDLALKGRRIMRRVQQAVLDLGEWEEDEVNNILRRGIEVM